MLPPSAVVLATAAAVGVSTAIGRRIGRGRAKKQAAQELLDEVSAMFGMGGARPGFAHVF